MTTCTLEYQIRQAVYSDVADLARLRWNFSDQTGHTFETFYQEFATFLQQALTSERWTVWVAEHSERIIANIYIQRVQKVPRPGRPKMYWGYVTNVYVEPFARKQGIGSHMLHIILQWARDQHIQFLIVWPAEESVNFYHRAGFVRNQDILELDILTLAEDLSQE